MTQCENQFKHVIKDNETLKTEINKKISDESK